MARHAMNRAWGVDASNVGTKMSNSAPQHRNINRQGGTWGELEDEIRDVVARPGSDINALWSISGAIYRTLPIPVAKLRKKTLRRLQSCRRRIRCTRRYL